MQFHNYLLILVSSGGVLGGVLGALGAGVEVTGQGNVI